MKEHTRIKPAMACIKLCEYESHFLLRLRMVFGRSLGFARAEYRIWVGF